MICEISDDLKGVSVFWTVVCVCVCVWSGHFGGCYKLQNMEGRLKMGGVCEST